MAKLESKLVEDISREPNKKFNVIIVIDSNTTFEELNFKDYKKLMDNIAYVSLTGKQINKASKNPRVQSIEEDSEMGIF